MRWHFIALLSALRSLYIRSSAEAMRGNFDNNISWTVECFRHSRKRLSHLVFTVNYEEIKARMFIVMLSANKRVVCGTCVSISHPLVKLIKKLSHCYVPRIHTRREWEREKRRTTCESKQTRIASSPKAATTQETTSTPLPPPLRSRHKSIHYSNIRETLQCTKWK